MNYLYVAWQDSETREWVPVAKLFHTEKGYELQYTRGALRCNNFSGFGRMIGLDKIHYSKTLFPFFANRMISKSRPEYKNYLSWLGLNDINAAPLNVLSVTGGLRATDTFELIPPPLYIDGKLTLDFFPRGLRYLSPDSLHEIAKLMPGEKLYLMRDIQNIYDKNALLLRTDKFKLNVGYIAKYYSCGISHLLEENSNNVLVEVKRVNIDAPLEMRLLCTLHASCKDNFQLLEFDGDFHPYPTLDKNSQEIQNTGLQLDLMGPDT